MTDSSRTPHPSLYFDDGDIELSAKASDGSVQLFKLHRIYLSRSSEVFRDMFAVGGNTKEEVEMPDNAADISALFEAICSATYVFLLNTPLPPCRACILRGNFRSYLIKRLSSTPKAQTVTDLSSLVRIARKYVVQDIADVLIDHVKSQWPRTLPEWDVQQFALAMLRASNLHDADKEHPEPASAIIFALEFNVPDILPAAFYCLGISRLQSNEPNQEKADVLPCARWDLLDAATLLRFMKGRRLVRLHLIA